MEPLVADMVQDDPTKHPTMDEVVTRFAEIRRKLYTGSSMLGSLYISYLVVMQCEFVNRPAVQSRHVGGKTAQIVRLGAPLERSVYKSSSLHSLHTNKRVAQRSHGAFM